MLFSKREREGIAAGEITLAYRRWRRLGVKVGGRYRTGGDGGRSMIGADGTRGGPAQFVEVEAVDRVAESRITAAEARAAGYPTVVALRAALPKAPELPLYRIRFRLVDTPDPRAELAADTDVDVAAVDAKLDRLDQHAPAPWTAATLWLIGARPGVVSTELAAELGRERFDFKQDVAKLKRLGLTLSLPVGYRLSPRGAAYLSQTRR